MAQIIGTENSDVLGGTASIDQYFGLGGDDLIIASRGADTIDGGDGFNTIDYSMVEGLVRLNINLTSGRASKFVSGRPLPEMDTLRNIQELILTSGGDFATGSAADEVIRGGAGQDTLNGSGGSNKLFGESGNDILTSSGSDLLDGGEGHDRLSFAPIHGQTGLVVDVATGTYSWESNGLSGAFANFEDYQGSNGDDRLLGSHSSDTLDGSAGNDTLSGAGGSDILKGGDGFDTVSYAGIASAVLVDFAAASASYDGGVDQFTSIEAAIGSRFSDELYGHDGSNRLDGGRGDDLLDGRGGIDTADYASAGSGVSVDLTVGRGESDGYVDKLISIENIHGSAFGDRLIGDDGENLLAGAGGDDHVLGGGGKDRLVVGQGKDVIDGGRGFDTLDLGELTTGAAVDFRHRLATSDGIATSFSGVESAIGSDADDTMISGSRGNLLYGGSGHDLMIGDDGSDFFIGGDGNDELRGGDGDDQLRGGHDDDALYGGDGDDILWGGDLIGDKPAGKTLMYGGDGRDIFGVHLERGDDIIADFNIAEDRIGADQGLDRAFSLAELIQRGIIYDDADGNATIVATTPGATATAKLLGVSVNDLTEANFLFETDFYQTPEAYTSSYSDAEFGSESMRHGSRMHEPADVFIA